MFFLRRAGGRLEAERRLQTQLHWPVLWRNSRPPVQLPVNLCLVTIKFNKKLGQDTRTYSIGQFPRTNFKPFGHCVWGLLTSYQIFLTFSPGLTTVFHRHSVVAQTTSPAMCSDSSCIHRGTSMGYSLIPADLCQRNAVAGLGPFPKTALLSCPHYLLQRGNVCSTGAPLLLLGWSHWRCSFINLGLAESHGPQKQLEHKVPPPGRIQLLPAALSFTAAPP